jgi:hypothetical protein
MSSWRKILFVVLAISVLIVFALPADAQCSMCRAALAGSGNGKFIRNFNIGVLVLLIPPVSIFCTIFVVLRRYRGEITGGHGGNTSDDIS